MGDGVQTFIAVFAAKETETQSGYSVVNSEVNAQGRKGAEQGIIEYKEKKCQEMGIADFASFIVLTPEEYYAIASELPESVVSLSAFTQMIKDLKINELIESTEGKISNIDKS